MSSTTYTRILSKGAEADLPVIENGKLRFTTDTGRLFLDTDNTRVEITDFVKDKTKEEILDLVKPLPKVYITSDTKELMIYNATSSQWEYIYISESAHSVNADTASVAINASSASYADNGIKNIDRDGTIFTVTRADDSTFTFTQQDNDTTYDIASTASAGLLQQLDGSTATYLRGDGIWANPTDNDSTYALTTGTTQGTVNFNDNGTTTDVAVNGLGAMAYRNSIDKSDVGLDNVVNYDQSKAVKSISRSGLSFTATALDGSTFGFTQKDDNTTYDIANTESAGLLPQLGGGTTNYLRADGSWQVPPNDNTTYDIATQSSAGLLPALDGSSSKYLNSNGEWTVPPNDNTTYTNATIDSNGLLPQLDGSSAKYLNGNGEWSIPPNDNTTYTNATIDSNGLLPQLGGGTTDYLRADGTWATPPNDNTTYTNGTGLSLSSGSFSIDESASTVSYAKNAATATADGSGNTITSYYAPIGSPAFTGTPTVPDVADGDNSGKVANTKFVTTAIANAISGISGISYEVVETLPATGSAGVIYLITNGSGISQDIYDEYIWLGSSYEKIGSTAMDLSNYLNTVSETGTGNAYTSFTKSGNTLTLTKGATFLTAVPSEYATTATYTATNGISKTGTEFSNSGVRAIAESATSGAINVNTNGSTADVAIHGLGALAYKSSVAKSDVGLDNVANIDQSKAIKNITRDGLTFTATALDGSTFTFNQVDNNTTYANATIDSNGLLPQLGGGTTNFLRADGQWAAPPNDNTTYDVASISAAGLLPQLGGGTTNYLRADGQWATPPNDNTTYDNFSTASAGLVPPSGSGTGKYLRGDGTWEVPYVYLDIDPSQVINHDGNNNSRTITTNSIINILDNSTYVKSCAPVEEADFDFGEVTAK